MNKEKTKYTLEKEAFWEKQNLMLGAPLYRVTIVDRNEERVKKRNLENKQKESKRFVINLCKNRKTGEEVLWTPVQLKNMIPMLQRRNADGFDIYITPVSSEYHYILLDDLTASGVEFVQKEYYPCIIQTSSQNNYQAVLKVTKIDDSSQESSCANDLLQKVNRELPPGCGGDSAINGARHPFRIQGFLNKKNGRNNYQCVPCPIPIPLTPDACCVKAMRMMQEIRESKTVQSRRQEKERRRKVIFSAEDMRVERPEGETAIERIFRIRWNRCAGLANKQVEAGFWEKLNGSVVDFRVVKELLNEGYDEVAVGDALFYCSPHLEDRHRKPDDYVDRTISAAKKALHHETIVTKQGKRIPLESGL